MLVYICPKIIHWWVDLKIDPSANQPSLISETGSHLASPVETLQITGV